MQLTPIWSGRLALAAAAVLALLIIWSLVRLVWLVIDGPQVEPAAMPPVPRAAPATETNGEFRWALFGDAQQRPAMIRTAPVTTLSLKLKGVVAAGQGGYAIISDDGGSDQVYRVGDELPGGGRVEAIEARRVLLERDGRTEALEMEARQAVDGSTGAQRRRDGDRQPVQLAGIRGMDVAGGASIASVADTGALQGANLQQLAGAISVMPVAGGGFRVRPGRDARLFADLGLQVNDVVTAINGQPLESEEDVRQLFTDIMRRGEVAITVNRQGRELTLRPDLEDILGRLE